MRRGVVSIAILICVAIAAMAGGAIAAKNLKPGDPEQQTKFRDTGGAIGQMIGGAPGRAIGEELGYGLALILGGLAFQRHGVAEAAKAKLSKSK